jgi:hypothetical protein
MKRTGGEKIGIVVLVLICLGIMAAAFAPVIANGQFGEVLKYILWAVGLFFGGWIVWIIIRFVAHIGSGILTGLVEAGGKLLFAILGVLFLLACGFVLFSTIIVPGM